MCNPACLAYGRAHLSEADVRGRRVIEVGSRNVNGSLRGYVTELGPASYRRRAMRVAGRILPTGLKDRVKHAVRGSGG